MKKIKVVGMTMFASLLLFGMFFAWQVWAQDNGDADSGNKIYIPWFSNNRTQSQAAAVTTKVPVPTPWYPVHPEDQHWLDKWQDLPYSEVPYEGAPVIRPDPSFVFPGSEIPPIESIKPSDTIIVAGPETTGKKINVLSKEVQLPSDIYVEAVVGSIMCVIIELDDGTFVSAPCPKTPYTVLSTTDGAMDVRIEPDGQVYTGKVGPEGLEGDRKKFQFVLDALGVELKLDPTFEIPVHATPLPSSKP